MSAGEFAKDVVRAMAGPQSEDITRLHRRIAELTETVASLTKLGNRVVAERDEARAAVDRVTSLAARRSTALVEMQRQRDDARAALERVATERDEARAEVVQLGKAHEQAEDDMVRLDDQLGEARERIVKLTQAADRDARTIKLLRAAVSGGPFAAEGFDRLRAAMAGFLTDAQVEERIERIKQTARERVEAHRLRTALAEERIEPERVNGHGKWCASLYAPPGRTYACDCNEVGAG